MISKTRGAIAAGHQKTAEAGQAMFALGGNAFDAAVAAVLAACVTEPCLTSVAGGGFLLAHTQDNQQLLFDFFTQTPQQKKPLSHLDFYPVEVNFGGAKQIFHIGKGAMAVPGNLAGLFTVQEKLGKLPFEEVAQPAIDYASKGVEISKFQDFCLTILEPIISASPESRNLFFSQGKRLQAGDIFKNSDFAITLKHLAKHGVKEFYEGEVARQLVEDCQKQGGHLTLEDLQSYQVIIRQPLKTHYRGYQVITNPSPSSGGTLISFSLQLLATINLANLEFSSQEHLQILAQVMSLTNIARESKQDDFPDNFLALEHLQNYQKSLQHNANKLGGTTHVSVIDELGNAASVTTSNGEGSGYIIPGTGIMVNNMLGEADLNPKGFHNWPTNQRLTSMMAPTIILQENNPQFVLGSGGSNRIRTAILQVISNLIDFKMSSQLAVESPRVHWENNLFHVEPMANLEVIDNLKLPNSSQVVLWPEKNMFFGGVHGVEVTNNALFGAGDSRRMGVFLK
ncbi:MAG: gamma-glutamyltransferase [Spirulinaceae cyanobacterium]